jgi:hypothetical protein
MSMQTIKNILISFLVPTLLFSFLIGGITFSFIFGIITFIVITGLFLFFGLPLFILLNKHKKVNGLTSMISAFSIGFLFAFLTSFPWNQKGVGLISGYGSQQATLMINGALTLDGWKEILYSSFQIGLLGLIYGLIFYYTYKSIKNHK